MNDTDKFRKQLEGNKRDLLAELANQRQIITNATKAIRIILPVLKDIDQMLERLEREKEFVIVDESTEFTELQFNELLKRKGEKSKL